MIDEIRKKLRVLFWGLLTPALLLNVGVEILNVLGEVTSMPKLHAAIPAAAFIAAVTLSVALPVLLRSLFAAGLRDRNSSASEDYSLFQLRVLACVCSTPYLAAVASLLMFPEFFHAGIVLASLYGCYVQYPSSKRIETEVRMFRVRP